MSEATRLVRPQNTKLNTNSSSNRITQAAHLSWRTHSPGKTLDKPQLRHLVLALEPSIWTLLILLIKVKLPLLTHSQRIKFSSMSVMRLKSELRTFAVTKLSFFHRWSTSRSTWAISRPLMISISAFTATSQFSIGWWSTFMAWSQISKSKQPSRFSSPAISSRWLALLMRHSSMLAKTCRRFYSCRLIWTVWTRAW